MQCNAMHYLNFNCNSITQRTVVIILASPTDNDIHFGRLETFWKFQPFLVVFLRGWGSSFSLVIGRWRYSFLRSFLRSMRRRRRRWCNDGRRFLRSVSFVDHCSISMWVSCTIRSFIQWLLCTAKQNTMWIQLQWLVQEAIRNSQFPILMISLLPIASLSNCNKSPNNKLALAVLEVMEYYNLPMSCVQWMQCCNGLWL